MLPLSAILLGLTAVFGVALFAIAARRPPAGRIWLPGAVHGLCGVIGFLLLLLALGGPARGVAAGAANFGVFAAWFVGAGLLLGGCAFAARLRRRGLPPVVIGVHATLAVAGIVMLGAYLAVG